METYVVDELLEAHHPARVFWSAVERLDLSAFEEKVSAREGTAGRNATDPRVLLTLWLYAYSEGIGSAREISRRCESDDPFKWICGGLTPNHTLLSEFAVSHQAALQGLFVELTGVLMNKGLVQLHRVALDGTRVRAAAGASSFRRERTLKYYLARARAHLREVEQQAREAEARNARGRSVALRVAREREQRLNAALAELEKLNGDEPENNKRVSTTDPEARVMKMPDGGFRPAYNVQLASDTQEDFIVGVRVTNKGTDAHEATPMLDEMKETLGQQPDQLLVDGGYHSKETIESAAARDVELIMPPNRRRKATDPLEPRPDDSPAVAAYKERMKTQEAKEIGKERGASIELVNGRFKSRQGLRQFLVRGAKKTFCVAVLHALAHNIGRLAALGMT